MEDRKKIQISALVDQIFQNACEVGKDMAINGDCKGRFYHVSAAHSRDAHQEYAVEAIEDLYKLLGMPEFIEDYRS